MKIEVDVAEMIATLEKLRNEVGIVRDKIQDFIDDAEELRDNCQDAFESVDYAITRLSELS